MSATVAQSDECELLLRREAGISCRHCGLPCETDQFRTATDHFCCQGCVTIYELLTENGLQDYYRLGEKRGIRAATAQTPVSFSYLDEPELAAALADYRDEKLTRITFFIPAIHCIACVWLLENLFRLEPAIEQSKVHFPRKELNLAFRTGALPLSKLVQLLATLGYEPELKLADAGVRRKTSTDRKLLLQLGMAGFAFGNIMLFSIAGYFGLDSLSGPAFRKLVGFVSFLLALPVVTYSADYYWKTALNSLRQKFLTIEVPIAAGIIAIFGQSAWEVFSGHGEGYFDSLTGLIFFLLCGRLFQQKTYERLAFDRDYRSFFPLSVSKPEGGSVSLSQVCVGDTLLIRNGELIPADARLASEEAQIDYSFVTGESEPVRKNAGDYLYAGGRQTGPAIEVVCLKPVSQSYLTSLWNQEAFTKENGGLLDSLINRYSRRFTKIIIAVAGGAALFWAFHDPSVSLRAFTSVLIVACPCAIVLATPFTLGAALRLLGQRDVYLKSAHVLETMAQIDTVVFDKTGTLTGRDAGAIEFSGAPLTGKETEAVAAIAEQSTHPISRRLAGALRKSPKPTAIEEYLETPGCGIEGKCGDLRMVMGSLEFLESRGIPAGAEGRALPATTHLAINGVYRGAFRLSTTVREDADGMLQRLSSRYEIALLSGDNNRELARFRAMFGPKATLRFDQSPLDKLQFIRILQKQGRRVLMVGDGLNDAGALKQSDAGIAVVEDIGAFSPASDVIMHARMIPHLDKILGYSKRCTRIIRLSFVLSSFYNVVGVSIAAAGLLAPIVCAVLMPLSSVSVAAFASGAATWAGARAGLKGAQRWV